MTHVGILLRLAARNIVRQRRRSALIATAMALGVALLILFLTIGDGMHDQWVNAGVRLADGHLTLEMPAFRRSAALEDRLDAHAVRGVAEALAEPAVAGRIEAAAPRLTVSALASSAASALPVRVLGVDPRAEARFSILPGKLTAGQFLTESDPTAAVVGQGIVDRLGLTMGSRFVVTAQTATGDVQEQLLHVTGIFRTGIRDVDEGLINVRLTTARHWLAAPGSATSFAILLRDDSRLAEVATALRPMLPPGVAAFTWRETAPELDAAIRIDNLGNYLFNGILLAIVALAVLEALLVSVIHRRREFGVLHAIGLSARETGIVVLGEGVILAVISGTIGMAVGLGVTWILGRTGLDLTAAVGNQLSVSGAVISPIIHPSVHVARALQGTVVVIVLGVLSSLYPMWQATHIEAAAAMQVEQ